MATTVACTCAGTAGELTYWPPAAGTAKPGDDSDADHPRHIARWTATNADAPLRMALDLIDDVGELMLGSKPPASAARVVITPERRAQLSPPVNASNGALVMIFPSNADRQAFVGALVHWRQLRRDADEAKHTATRDAEEEARAASRVKVEGAPAEDTKAGVVMPSDEELALDRRWHAHDVALRQLYKALVTDGLMGDDEFDAIHAEEKHAFYTSPSMQQLGLSSVHDALAELVDPQTHELRPVTEQVAANVFRQAPALARIYKRRVATPEDEIVFWDAVVRRALFMARTFLDAEVTTDADLAGTGTATAGATAKPSGNDAVLAEMNARSDVALAALAAARGDGGVAASRATADEVTEAADVLRRGLANEDLANTLDASIVAPRGGAAASAATLVVAAAPPPCTITAAQHARLRDTASVLEGGTWLTAANNDGGSSPSRWSDVLIPCAPLVVAAGAYGPAPGPAPRDRGAPAEDGGAALRHAAHKPHVPARLRTFHSLHRLFWQHALQPTDGTIARRDGESQLKRCRGIVDGMRRALADAKGAAGATQVSQAPVSAAAEEEALRLLTRTEDVLAACEAASS